MRYALVLVTGAASVLLGAGCEPREGAPRPPAPEPAPAASEPSRRMDDPGVPACPDDMVLVEGAFCPAAEQRCLRHDAEYVADPSTSERCLEYASPSACLSSRRRLMRYCIDRYEWPNRKGELPLVLVDFRQAREACEGRGKRLCDEDEWLFACEGEEMVPYVYGYRRDPTQCVIDRLYVERTASLAHYDDCMADPDCRARFASLDQREAAGSFPGCASPFGAFDMNGNVNEWVNVPGASFPHRSGLKGGWWGPVRNRCRPTVRFHDEHDWGYEVGFRCCRDAAP